MARLHGRNARGGAPIGKSNSVPIDTPREVGRRKKEFREFLQDEMRVSGLVVNLDASQSRPAFLGVLRQYEMRKAAGKEDLTTLARDCKDVLQMCGLIAPDIVATCNPVISGVRKVDWLTLDGWTAVKRKQWDARDREATRQRAVSGKTKLTQEEKDELAAWREQDKKTLRKTILENVRTMQGDHFVDREAEVQPPDLDTLKTGDDK